MKKIKFCLILTSVFMTMTLSAASNKKESQNEVQVEKKVDFFNGQSSFLSLRPMKNWSTWGRDPNALTCKIKEENQKSVYEISYKGKNDFSVNVSDCIEVNPKENGESYLFCSNVLLFQGTVSLSFVLRDCDNNVINWLSSDTPAQIRNSYQMLYCYLTVPKNVKYIEARITGYGKTAAKIINPTLEKVINKPVKEKVEIENKNLKVTCYANTASFDVVDKRINKVYRQSKSVLDSCIIVDVENSTDFIKLKGLNFSNKCYVLLSALLKDDSIEYLLDFEPLEPILNKSEILMTKNISWPQKSLCSQGDYLVIPMNEGLRVDWNEENIHLYDLQTFSGHGLSMPFYGLTNDFEGNGFICIIESPDDAAVKIEKQTTNCAGPVWYGQKGRFGYERKMTQTFLTSGNHVGIAKKYREYAKKSGKLVTFEQKKAQRGKKGAENIDKFLGSVNIWTWQAGDSAVNLAKKIYDAGIKKVLWSREQNAETVKKINELGFICGKYVIYQDVMNPKNYKYLTYVNEQWLPQAYPDDIAIDKNGKLTDAWPVERKDGKGFINCASLCDMKAVNYSRSDLKKDLEEKDFGARFFDTATASPFKECYSPDHPMTRTECKEERIKLLGTSSLENGLVTGSETGLDAVVPVCDYFEGMMSLGPYRVEEAGRNMDTILDEVLPQIIEYQLNEKRRLPLWELVYHDSCVAMWYWGDYNNKLPAVWDKRDKFNQLYAVPPMFWVHGDKYFDENKDRFVQSYNASHEILMKTAGVEMVNHQYLNKERTVQKTTFANGVEVVVDFSE